MTFMELVIYDTLCGLFLATDVFDCSTHRLLYLTTPGMNHVQDEVTEELPAATRSTEAISTAAPLVTLASSTQTAAEAMHSTVGTSPSTGTAPAPAHDTAGADPEAPEEPAAVKCEALTRGADALSVGVQVAAALVMRNVARKGAHPTLLMPHLETLTEVVAAHLQHSKYIADVLLALP